MDTDKINESMPHMYIHRLMEGYFIQYDVNNEQVHIFSEEPEEEVFTFNVKDVQFSLRRADDANADIDGYLDKETNTFHILEWS